MLNNFKFLANLARKIRVKPDEWLQKWMISLAPAWMPRKRGQGYIQLSVMNFFSKNSTKATQLHGSDRHHSCLYHGGGIQLLLSPARDSSPVKTAAVHIRPDLREYLNPARHAILCNKVWVNGLQVFSL